MSNYIKILSSILLLFLSLTYFSSQPVAAQDPPPPIAGEYGVAIDAATGEILYNKNADVQSYPASMTKVMTAIVLDENLADNQMLTVSTNAAGQECNCFGFTPGEQISKKDALYGLLLLSANDLAVAIAENVAGSVEGFAQLMNAEVKKLGLHQTHFVTPNGLHDPNHYTTSHDMALIMKEALKHPNVINALSTQAIDVHTSLQAKTIRNKSEVHKQPPEAHVIAGKTGFTDQAGNTLVEYLKDGDKEVIAVVMKTHKKEEYTDIQAMANYAFAQMKTEKIASNGEVIDKKPLYGEKVKLITPVDIAVGLRIGDNSKLTTKIQLLNTAGETIKKGQVVANLQVLKSGQIVKETPLVTGQAIKGSKSLNKIGETDTKKEKTEGVSTPVMIVSGILLILAFVVFVIRVRVQYRKKAFENSL